MVRRLGFFFILLLFLVLKTKAQTEMIRTDTRGQETRATSMTADNDGQSTSVLAYIKHAMRFSRYYPQEKVYLHLDNTGYFKGETIWFKAYVVRCDTEQRTDLSHVLYVELLNPSGDVVEKRKLPIENGEAHGDIKVDSIQTTGFYEVRPTPASRVLFPSSRHQRPKVTTARRCSTNSVTSTASTTNG